MAIKHTLGPWIARWDTVRYAGQRERLNRCVISTPPNDSCACRVVARIEGPFAGLMDEARANARLIAAAPELYEALRGLSCRDLNDGPCFCLSSGWEAGWHEEKCKRIRAVLAEVED